MRVLAILVLLVGVHVHAGPRRGAPAGFDHGRHATAKPDQPCVACHVLAGAAPRPATHATCFGSCHQDRAALLKLPSSIADSQLAYCNPCHAETALVVPRDRKALAVPRATDGLDRAAQLGHQNHAQIACSKCHDPRQASRQPRQIHERCTGCHGREAKVLPLGACEGCHTGAGPRLVRSQVRVTSAFSHAKHATRGAARSCATCHAAITATASRDLPSPPLATCTTAGCHDGKAAFDAIGPCTKCHVDAPRGEFAVARPDAPYSHAKHAPVVKTSCGGCHRMAKTGEVSPAGHRACVEGCHDHEAEFGMREPKICGACHDGTEPWRPLIADRLPLETTEFGATLEHTKHAGACGGCHVLTTSRTELRPPRGHRACTGCHAMTGGPAPQMTSCEACHQPNLSAAREAMRLAARWSVRATFNHRAHAAKVAVDCVRCHTDLGSPTTLSLAPPPKSACAAAGCHDGAGAFKVSGTSCTRCHPGAPR